MSKRQTHGGRPIGRMDAPADKRTYTVPQTRASFEQERGAADEDWRHRAACRPDRLRAEGLDASLWFPIGNTGPALAQIEEARAVCLRCPVIEACFAWAIATSQDGVAGGMSEDERKAYKRRKQRGATGLNRKYSDEQRAEVLAALHEALPSHENVRRAAYAVCKRFGLDDKTVVRWFEDAESAVASPGSDGGTS